MESSLVYKARTALQNAAAKAERVLTEIKADIKADFGRPSSPEVSTRLGGKYNPNVENKAELPWAAKNESEKRHEAEFKRRILDLSKKPADFLEKVYDENHYTDVRTAMMSVGTILEYDDGLRDLWFLYVPKKMKEQEFWRRYFIAVKCIRQEVIDAESENAVSRSWSNLERRLAFGGIGNESLRKDPLEEEAYKEAFSVVAIPPSMIVRRLAAAIEVGRGVKSMQDLATQGGRVLDRDSVSNSGDWSGIVSSFAAMKRLSGSRDKENKLRSSRNGSLGAHQTLLWSLFDADTQHEEREDNKFSPTGAPKLPEEVHGAPPESFVAQLAEIMAGIKSEQGMAEFWLEVIKELRRRWIEGQPISRMPVDEIPDLRYCLLHQQLQLINCCIARRKRRAADVASLEALSEYGARGLDSQQSSDNGLSPLANLKGGPPLLLFAKTKSGEKVFRIGADRPAGDLLMLETGEQVYSPITQENPVMTEDAIRETEELILRTRSVGAGCSQLLSDMQAFKAANPGCILEDFVRWYSPLDWREEPGSGLMFQGRADAADDEAAIRGYLSARMQCEGNLWQELWASSRPVPAVKQAPLFDEELAGESTLDTLENVAPSDFFEQLFTAALSAGFAIAEAAPAAKGDALSKCLRECSDYVVSTCGRGMSTSKLVHLCEVYEVMETAVNTPCPNEPAGAEMQTNHGTGATNLCREDSVVSSPDPPIPLLEFERITARKSLDPPGIQFNKGENMNYLLSRIFEVKTSLFEKRHLRSFGPDGDRRPSPTVSGEWTFV